VAVPEASEHTSIKERVDHVKAQGRNGDLKAARTGSVAGSGVSAGLEESYWLCPIEDRRRLDSSRDEILKGFSAADTDTRRQSRADSAAGWRFPAPVTAIKARNLRRGRQT